MTPVIPAPRDVMPHTELWVLVAAMWLMGTDPGFSATAAGVLNHWPYIEDFFINDLLKLFFYRPALDFTIPTSFLLPFGSYKINL